MHVGVSLDICLFPGSQAVAVVQGGSPSSGDNSIRAREETEVFSGL